MKIKESQVTLASSRSFQEKISVKSEYRLEWAAMLNEKFQEQFKPDEGPQSETRGETHEALDISDPDGALLKEMRSAIGTGNQMGNGDMNGIVHSLLELIIQKMISMELLIGELTDFKYDFHYLALGKKSGISEQPRSFQMNYTLYEERSISRYEKEHTRFSSEGGIETEEGKRVDFVLNLDMKREFLNETKLSLKEEGAIQWIDPLVLTFKGAMPELSDFKFSLDLDLDGKTEALAGFKAGSGFLSFDRNKDGVINDGSELFGPTTGSGFDELKTGDSDQNGWIDENDLLFSELSVWTPGESDNGNRTSLKEAGVGALYLGHSDTDFSIRDLSSSPQAVAIKIRETGLFLNEDGSAGAIQEVDFNPFSTIS